MTVPYQAPGNRTITSIDSKIPVLGSAVAAQSVPVVIATDQVDVLSILTGDAPLALKITVAGQTTYVAIAPVGTLQAAAAWQAKRIAVVGADTVTTYADGDALFDNVATNLAALAYS